MVILFLAGQIPASIPSKLILQALHPDEDDSAEDDEVADEDEEEPGMFDDAEEEANGAGDSGDGPEQMDAD